MTEMSEDVEYVLKLICNHYTYKMKALGLEKSKILSEIESVRDFETCCSNLVSRLEVSQIDKNIINNFIRICSLDREASFLAGELKMYYSRYFFVKMSH